jgi:ParB/Sulfiredoxin domain
MSLPPRGTVRIIPLTAFWPPVHPADPEKVALFATLMCDGVVFPPVRAVEGLPGRYRITDGAHRAAAARLARLTHVPAVVR